ncbi:MBL fold metallo-hydrolase [Tabrizicola sp. J26]|uniref:MBL fold metallo-hydrolase n=1 Tax=Alitabrizicola rongguiensis TaxID=2909234 RepID=UPI001F3D1D8B|nr:MBL fold metallo-hydrolase [Tabrizicola rongguiensis]MCF1707658.1 MBL fold metallo-hydrolase [Tabrizicola rongguiensis]
MREEGGIRFPFDLPPAEGEVVQVAEGILWIRLPLPMALDHVNVFALADDDGWTLVDTGLDTRKTRALWQRLLDGPLAGRPVARVIVTHHHPDHVGLAGWFQSQGAELWTTRTSWLYARMLVLDEQQTPSPQQLRFWRRAGMSDDEIARRMVERPFNFADCVAHMPVGFFGIEEGDVLTLADRHWLVLLGGGHAPDHITLWSESDGLILGGDQLLPGISANIGVYPTEPEADPLSDWIESCKRFRPLATHDQLVLPGHKLPFTGLPLRLTQMIENHESALGRLHDHLSKPRLAIECFPALFKREIGSESFSLALAETVAHLNHLLRSGVVRRDDRQGAWLWHRS